MPRGKKQNIGKHACLKEIISQLNIEWNPDYISGGSTITVDGIKAVLDGVSLLTGIPPSFISEKEREIRRLLHKSQESFLLSIEMINKITIPYKIESFCFLFCNAWELLLKSKLLLQGENIRDAKNPQKTYGIGKCARKVLGKNDAIYKNLMSINELRDEATHLFIDIIPYSIMGVFQAGASNFSSKLFEWFDIDITKRVPGGTMNLIIDANLSKVSVEALNKRLTADTLYYLKGWEKKMAIELDDINASDINKFINPINIKLAYVKNPNKADTIQYLGSSGKGVTKIIQTKDPDKDYPYFTKELIEKLKEKKITLNIYDITKSLATVYGIKDNNKFCYIPSKHNQPQYSQALVDWLKYKVEQEPDFIVNTRLLYKDQINEKKNN